MFKLAKHSKVLLASLTLTGALLIGGGVNTVAASDNVVTCRDISDHRIYYSKENVRRYTEWSYKKRVSDNLSGNRGDSITSEYSKTFSAEASGSYHNLGFSLGASVSSRSGYRMHLPSRGVYYMAYSVKFNVERGTRVARTSTGKVIGRESYCVKIPSYGYGEYSLVKVR